MSEAKELTAEEEAVLREQGLLMDSWYRVPGRAELLNANADDIWALLDASRAREKALVEALMPLLPLLRLLTISQVIKAGHDAIEAVGLNPYCIKEGLATGDEPIPLWKFEALLPPYSTPSPDMPSDCHPQGE